MFWGPVYFGPSLTFIMIRQRSPFLVNLYPNWNLIQTKLLHAAGFKSVKLTKKCKLLVFDWFLANVPLSLLKVHVKVTSRLIYLMVPMVCHSTDIMYVFISLLQKIVEMIWKEWESWGEYILKHLPKREAINKGTTRSRIAGMTLTDSKRLLYP